MQKKSCEKQATASSVEDARCWTSQGSNATCGDQHFEIICMVFLLFLDLSRFIDVHRWLTHRRPQNAQSKRSFCRILFLGCFVCLAKIWWLHHGCICVILPGHSRGSATQGLRGLRCQPMIWWIWGICGHFSWMWPGERSCRAPSQESAGAGFPPFPPYQCCVPGSVRMPQDCSGCSPANAILQYQQPFHDLPHTSSPFLIPKFTTCKFTSCFVESQDTKWAAWAFYIKILCPWQERKHEEEIMQKREANNVLSVDGAKLKLNWFPGRSVVMLWVSYNF